MKSAYRLLLVCTVLLTACGGSEEDIDAKPLGTAEELYDNAYGLFRAGKLKDSVPAFEEVERQHPASEWAVNAQIMSAYASYYNQDYDQAVSTLQRFTKLYPSHESTPYAYYMIALSYYEQITDVGRDQRTTELAMRALREVVRRFPETEYARDATIKLDLTQDHLSGKEMEIGRYYLRHNDYLAAANRFRFVVENYQTTSHVPEALHRMVECYLELGVRDEAMRYAAVLGHNFPSSLWYRDSYKLLTGKTVAQVAENEDEQSGDWWDAMIPSW